MRGPTILEALRGVGVLDGVPEKEQGLIASAARLEEYEPDDVIFEEGDCPDVVFVLAEGSVALDMRVPAHGARWFQTVGPGELLGWSPALGHLPMTATARAVTPIRLVILDSGTILSLCRREPRFGYAFMRRVAEAVAERFSATRGLLLGAYAQYLPAYAGYHEGAD